MQIIRRMLGSLVGQIFLMLALSTAATATITLLISEQMRRNAYAESRADRISRSVADIAGRLELAQEHTLSLMTRNALEGVALAPPDIVPQSRDTRLERAITELLGDRSDPVAGRIPASTCDAIVKTRNTEVAGVTRSRGTDCWIVDFTDDRGQRWHLDFHIPRIVVPTTTTMNPVFFLAILTISAILAILVARFAAVPLRRLVEASERFAISLDPKPIPAIGPSEVRRVLSTFNLMQERVQEGFAARTRLLAGISHDLQTPITRMRLRAEKIEDEALRERMIADLAAMRSMVTEGLDLARSSERTEEISRVDIDSLLSSMAEDAEDLGMPIEYIGGCDAIIAVPPHSLMRCLTNLTDNAVKYAGGAKIQCRKENDEIHIMVLDDGPGIPEDRLEKMFEPFTRGGRKQAGGRDGTGIGLTVARTLAANFGASITLANRAEGGLIATMTVPLG